MLVHQEILIYLMILKKMKSNNIDESEYILCTGLFDEFMIKI